MSDSPTPTAVPRAERVPVRFQVNGQERRIAVQMHDSLLDALRGAGLAGVKRVCETSDCGACAVLLDGRLVNSCAMLALQADEGHLRTIEGVGTPEALHPLQAAFLRHAAAQCGFCIPGMILSMLSLLERHPDAGRAEIRDVMTLCRCTGYVKPIAAVLEFQDSLRRDGTAP